MASVPPFGFYHFHDRMGEEEGEERMKRMERLKLEEGEVKLPQQVGPSLDIGERRTVRNTGFLAGPIYTGNACLCHPVGSHLLCPGQLPAKRGAAKRRQGNRIGSGAYRDSRTRRRTGKERKRRNTERYTESEERTRGGRRVPSAIGGSVTSNAMAVDAGGSSWLSGCPSCSQKTSRGLLSCAQPM